MSIALSAVARPSRLARHILSGWALAQCAAAALVLASPAGFVAPRCLAASLAGAGLALACAAARTPKTHRIDISGTGELRVTVQQNVGAAKSMTPAAAPDLSVPPQTLLSGSVRWPGLIVLRVCAGAARPRVVPVWRDSVDGDTWRALAVALAVIGRPGRQDGGSGQHR